MNALETFLSSNRGKKLLNYFYSWGAAIVIIGATFKIVHLPYANVILMVGMFTEALVFIISGFDNSPQEAGNSASGVILAGSAIEENTANNNYDAKVKPGNKGNTGSVVIVNGSTGGSNTATNEQQFNPTTNNQGNNSSSKLGSPINQNNSNSNVPEYSQSINNTAQNLEEFSNTIQALNEASQKLLGAYNQITNTNGFIDNISTLNQNVSGLNDVFNAQLQTITEQMSAIRYINDSLSRMKNLYDGAIGDSYMFREESAKMTKHIEALNIVYARLLQAMTNNNNPNNTPNY